MNLKNEYFLFITFMQISIKRKGALYQITWFIQIILFKNAFCPCKYQSRSSLF